MCDGEDGVRECSQHCRGRWGRVCPEGCWWSTVTCRIGLFLSFSRARPGCGIKCIRSRAFNFPVAPVTDRLTPDKASHTASLLQCYRRVFQYATLRALVRRCSASVQVRLHRAQKCRRDALNVCVRSVAPLHTSTAQACLVIGSLASTEALQLIQCGEDGSTADTLQL